MTVPNLSPSASTLMPPRWHEPAAVYRLWDADGNLLYIGSAYDPDQRCKEHRKKPWWPEVARRTEEWCSNRGSAYKVELEAIAVERSKYNAMGTPSYRTPDTEAVRRRKELAPLRQKLLEESWRVERAARRSARASGAPADDVERAGKLAGIEFLEDTGLFAASVKERRRRLAAEEASDG
ncbi:GIY-YIG nuclease family protein [Streptomyces mirabilis]|uniref:GIY-YIG nuclease family protein n=1 Tax=Streptomyces mirabilis TaxID=68239 RepID=UPI00369AB793